jgi:hypothetical protein
MKLQPCPFCAGSVTHRFYEPDGLGDYEPQHNFICNNCEVVVILVDVSFEKAIEIYNNRPDSPTVIAGQHHAEGTGDVTAIDVRGPAVLDPGTKSSASGIGKVTATRIG